MSATVANATPESHPGCRCAPGHCVLHPHLDTCSVRIPTVAVQDSFGRVRYARLFPDGESYSCPFCGAGVIPSRTEIPCPNPWCAAHPAAHNDVARARHVDAAHDEGLREQERRWNIARAESGRRYAQERAEAERTITAERREQAIRAGQCVTCATADYYRPKFTRHRAGHPHLAAIEGRK